MGANTRRTSRVNTPSQRLPGDTGIYFRASRYREELLEEARTLRRAGKIRSARGVESRMRQVDQLLGALECDGYAHSSAAADTSH